MTATQVKCQLRQAALAGDPIAMSVVVAAAHLPDDATDWVFEDYGDDPATVEYILRGMLRDD